MEVRGLHMRYDTLWNHCTPWRSGAFVWGMPRCDTIVHRRGQGPLYQERSRALVWRIVIVTPLYMKEVKGLSIRYDTLWRHCTSLRSRALVSRIVIVTPLYMKEVKDLSIRYDTLWHHCTSLRSRTLVSRIVIVTPLYMKEFKDLSIRYATLWHHCTRKRSRALV